MDPRFYVIREERCRVIAPLLEDPMKFLFMEPSAMSSDEYAKQLPVLEATHNVNFHTYQRPPVATQVQHQPVAQYQQVSYYDPAYYDQHASQAPPAVKKPAPGKVIDSNEAARIYGGYVIKGQAPPPVKKPAHGKVIDSNEAARIYGGVVIKGRFWYNGKEILERLRDKRVILVGDSLNRNQWESLACLLYSASSSSKAHLDERSGSYKVFKSKEYNCSLEFYWSPFLVELEVNKANGNRILKLDKICDSAMKWNGADIMVFNTVHWWTHNGELKPLVKEDEFCRGDMFEYGGKLVEKMEMETAFGIVMRSWGSWVDQNVDRNKTRVLFRIISPEHKGKQWCFNKTEPITDESFVWSFLEAMVEIVEKTMEAMKNPVTYLNITKLSSYRRDAHPSVYKTKEGKTLMATKQKLPENYADCSHWCLPGVPDTWNRLLFASSKNIPTS